MTNISSWSAPRALLFAGTALTFLLSGCAGLFGGEEDSFQVFMLNARSAISSPALPTSGVLIVQVPRAQPGYDTRRIAYSRGPLSIAYYANSEWADAPATMLTPLVVQALESSEAFSAVVAAPARARANLLLELDLIQLRQDFSTSPSRAQLALRATLVDVSGRRVLSTRLLQAESSAPSEDAEGGVIAANAALGEVLTSLVAFVMEGAGKLE